MDAGVREVGYKRQETQNIDLRGIWRGRLSESHYESERLFFSYYK